VGERKVFRRKKFCNLCSNRIDVLDYKDIDLLKRFISDRGKIIGRKQSGMCAKHQRKLAMAVKRAREVGLLPFTVKY